MNESGKNYFLTNEFCELTNCVKKAIGICIAAIWGHLLGQGLARVKNKERVMKDTCFTLYFIKKVKSYGSSLYFILLYIFKTIPPHIRFCKSC